MNREIKFRAWDGEAMRYPGHFGLHGYLSSADILGRYETVMQYTGLKDKNGKEIYESDILFFHGKKKQARFPQNVVFWNVKRCRWSLRVVGSRHPDHQEISLDMVRLSDYTNGGHYTVIGNIYENGDLLK